VPARVERERYFKELSYVELSALFAGPLKPGALARWAEIAPAGSIGLVAPAVLTHRKAPSSAKPWPSDATTGDFRDSALSRAALAPLADAVKQLRAGCVVFRSPESFSASAANREQLARFFGEIATEETVGARRVWLPGGVWEVRTALALANELGVTLGFDPLVRAPEEPPEVHYDLEAESLYFRIENAGRSGTIRNEKLEDLAMLVQHYEDLQLIVAFASPERWADARNLKKLFDAEAAATREED
jgi:uncharacterized protein YecE (DUF72 family)